MASRAPTRFRARNVCFTGYDEREMKAALDTARTNPDVKYWIYQVEECPNTQRRHLQGYIEFSKQLGMNQIKALLGSRSVHLEKRRGTAKQAADYCRKEDSRLEGPWEHGTISGQGKRTDLDHVREMIKEGASMLAIADEHFGSYCRYEKSFDNYRDMLERKKQKKVPEVHVLWGDAGTGKTRYVWDNFPGEDIYVKSLGGRWFDGYRNHKVALLDDFTGDMELGLFLKLLDRFPLTVEIKGGSRYWNPEQIFITSNLSPEDWFPKATAEQHAAIRRRFTTLKEYRWVRGPDGQRTDSVKILEAPDPTAVVAPVACCSSVVTLNT